MVGKIIHVPNKSNESVGSRLRDEEMRMRTIEPIPMFDVECRTMRCPSHHLMTIVNSMHTMLLAV